MWNGERMDAIAALAWTALDCADPVALAAFYTKVTGWPVDDSESDDEWVQLLSDSGPTLAFQRVADYQPPVWPGQDHPQQEHLDFAVNDLDLGEAQVIAAGARKHEFQPGHMFRVYLDPADHPFCLILR